MSLTTTDFQEIRTIVREEVRTIVREEVRTVFDSEGRAIVRDEVARAFSPIEGRLTALENDVKEIYQMLKDAHSATFIDKGFQKLTLEAKLLKLNTELLAAAKQAGIILPRS